MMTFNLEIMYDKSGCYIPNKIMIKGGIPY